MSPRTAAALVALATLAAAKPVSAQVLGDPTRPPNFSGLSLGAAAATPSGPVLQSIVLSPRRRLALIDGKLIGIGDRVGGATLVAIEIDSVRLQEGRGTKVVKLLPDVRKGDTESAALRTDPKRKPMGEIQ